MHLEKKNKKKPIMIIKKRSVQFQAIFVYSAQSVAPGRNGCDF